MFFRLEMVDSRLAEAHRVVMQRTANRYLVNIFSITWPGVRDNKVDQSCFKPFTGLRSCLLNQALAREFVEGGVTTMGNTANMDMSTVRQEAFHQPNP